MERKYGRGYRKRYRAPHLLEKLALCSVTLEKNKGKIKNKGLLRYPPKTTGKTKTNIVADKVALNPQTVVAESRAAGIRIVEPGAAPQYSSFRFLRKIIIIKPSTSIRWRTFLVVMPIIKAPFQNIPVHIV